MLQKILLAASLVLASHAFAREPEILTLAAALARAEAGNARLVAARARLDGAASAVATARQYPNPELESTMGGVRARAPGIATGRGTSVSIAQPIETPRVRETRTRAAAAQQTASDRALAEARLELFAAVKQAYLDVLQRKDELALALDSESNLEQIRYRIEVRVRVGEAPKLELTRADAELARARAATTTARLRIEQALATLAATIGTPFERPIDVAPIPLEDPPLLEAAALRSEIEARHPGLEEGRALVARAEGRLENERALRSPQPSLIAGFDRQPETSQVLFGVALPLPLFNRREGQIGEARAALDEARATLEVRRVELFGTLDIALRRAAIARAQLRALEGGVVRDAQNALAVADAAYRLGERGFIEVLDAQRVLRQVRADLVAARFELQAALVEIARVRAIDPRQGVL